MPVFEFVCKRCNHKFEELCRRDVNQISCPECGSKDTVKQFSAFGFSVSGGSGFRSTGSGSCTACSGGNCTTCR